MTDTFTTGSKPTITKDPAATLDYTFNWTAWLTASGNDTITSATVVVATGLTLVGAAAVTDTGRKVVAFISGGTAGTTYKVTCQITTVNSPARIDERDIYIKCVER